MESMVEKTKDEKCGLKQDEDSEPCGKKATHYLVNMGEYPFTHTFLCEDHALWISMVRRHLYGDADCFVVDRIASVDEMTPEEEKRAHEALKLYCSIMGLPYEEENEDESV